MRSLPANFRVQATTATANDCVMADLDTVIGPGLIISKGDFNIAKQGTNWQLTAATLGDGFGERAERLATLRRDENQQMQDYVTLPLGEHMGFFINALDCDPPREIPDVAALLLHDLFADHAIGPRLE